MQGNLRLLETLSSVRLNATVKELLKLGPPPSEEELIRNPSPILESTSSCSYRSRSLWLTKKRSCWLGYLELTAALVSVGLCCSSSRPLPIGRKQAIWRIPRMSGCSSSKVGPRDGERPDIQRDPPSKKRACRIRKRIWIQRRMSSNRALVEQPANRTCRRVGASGHGM